MSENKTGITPDTVKKIMDKIEAAERKTKPRFRISPIIAGILCFAVMYFLDESPVFGNVTFNDAKAFFLAEAGVDTHPEEKETESVEEESEESTEEESSSVQEEKTLRVTAEKLNVRESPDGAVIGSVQSGDELTYYDMTQDGWYRIEYEGGEGYVYSGYVTPLE